jgi:flagellar basal-body rod protein FlgB
MNLANIPLVQAMTDKMGYLSTRQAVLARNIANADTPGYHPMDVKDAGFASHVAAAMQSASQMRKTNAMHMDGMNAKGKGNIVMRKSPEFYERNPDNNRVSIDEEVAKASQTQADYNLTISLYRKTLDMFRIAAGRPGGA